MPTLEQITERILEDYRRGRTIDAAPPGRPIDPGGVRRLLEKLRRLLFPGFFREETGCDPDSYVRMLTAQILCLLQTLTQTGNEEETCRLCHGFLLQIPDIRDVLERDLQAFLEGDPAAAGAEEVVISYPGYYAITVYRLAHALWDLGVPVLPRMMTEQAHSRTGIDIHPGAVIGGGFFIDHGTGVVIGQTTRIGTGAKLYQGVTLGALSTRGGKKMQGVKRHPTLGDRVTVYAGATILGGATVIGEGAVIGANAFVTGSVPPGATVIGYRKDPE